MIWLWLWEWSRVEIVYVSLVEKIRRYFIFFNGISKNLGEKFSKKDIFKKLFLILIKKK